MNNHKGMAGCRFVLAAALAVALAGRLKCAEFEVMDVLRVDGYAVLESSVDITGNRFYVGGSSFAVAYGKIGIGTSTPSFPLQVSAAPGTAGEMLVISTGASNVIRLTGAGEVYANRFYGDISGASGFSGGDNLGSHIATTTLQMGAYGVNTSSNITAARYQINGSTMVAVLPGIDSIAYGVYAGTSNITGGNYNVFVGNSAGASNTTGTQNSFVGAYAGYSNTTASENSFFGYYAGYKNTTGIDNSFLSRAAGYFNTTGTQNSFVGSTAGYSNSTGKNNSIMGTFAGLYNQTGSANSIFGSEAGGFNNWGGSGSFSSSTIVGYQAGNKVTTGGDNILVGYRAGYGVTTGTGNIVIGYNKDTSVPGASNELNIGGLVYGDLSAKTVGINRVAQQAALDVVSTGTTVNQYAQIWRDSTGLIVSSMTATGVLYPAVPAADNTKVAKAGDTMTGQLTVSGSSLTVGGNIAVSTIAATGNITAARYQINGSTVLAILPGSGNLGVGVDAGGLTVDGGDYNSFVGYHAGYSNTLGGLNAFVGSMAGYSNTTGQTNSFFGANAGVLNTTGWSNTYGGYQTGRYNQAGSANTIFGADAGYGVSNNSFSSSTLVGYRAGYGLTTGSDNILLGWQAGYTTTSGARNIVIGYDQRTSADAASNELNIGGVLYGNLTARTIGISTRVPQAALDIVSTGTAANVYAQLWRASDGVIKASMSATGVMMATKFIGDASGLTGLGDNLGNHVATTTLNMAGFSVNNISTIAASGQGIYLATHTFVTQGYLGVGTTNPLDKLDVVGNIRLKSDGSTTYKIYTTGTGRTLEFQNVNTPSEKLAFTTSVNAFGDSTSDTVLAVIPAAGWSLFEGAGGQGTVLSNTGAYPIVIAPNRIETMRITSDGLVGISTRAPQAALDIVSTGTLVNQYAQIWRASDGTIVSSMTATGVLYPVVSGSDNTKVAKAGDTMTGQLTISGSSLTVIAPTAIASSLWVSTSATTPHLYVSTNGNIGVGTGAPLANFHVHASAAGALGPRLMLSNTGGAGAQVALDLSTYLPGNNAPGGRISATDDGNFGSTIAFQNKTPGAMGNSLQTRMIISNTGNIGIGTISPSQKLQVGDGSAPTAAEVRGNGTGYDAGFRIWNTHTFTGASSYLDFGWGTAPAVAAIHARSQADNSTDLVLQGSNISKTRSDMLYIDGSNGNIGIGTAAPAADLHISSTSASAAQDMLKISTGTANADVFVVKGNGNVGIGTTPPAYRLAVSSGAGESGTILAVSTGTSTMIELQGDGDVIAKRFIGDGSSLTNVTANAGVYTLAQMNTLAPAAAGRLISVSDAAAPYSYCVSTGTAAGAWVMLNQTIHCQ